MEHLREQWARTARSDAGSVWRGINLLVQEPDLLVLIDKRGAKEEAAKAVLAKAARDGVGTHWSFKKSWSAGFANACYAKRASDGRLVYAEIPILIEADYYPEYLFDVPEVLSDFNTAFYARGTEEFEIILRKGAPLDVITATIELPGPSMQNYQGPSRTVVIKGGRVTA